MLNTESENQSGISTVPNAPKVSQGEFIEPESNTDYLASNPLVGGGLSNSSSCMKNEVDKLPTPLAKNFHSPIRMNHSPSASMEGSIVVNKKRSTNMNIMDQELSKLGTYANIDNRSTSNGRVISEYIPGGIDNVQARVQRAVSLSTEADVSGNSNGTLKKEVIINEESQNLTAGIVIENPDLEGDKIRACLLSDLDKFYEWTKIKEIGSGNFSTVFLYESTNDVDPKLTQVAVKRIKYPQYLITSSSPNSTKYRELLSRVESSLKRELSILRKLDHPCVVKLYGVNDPAFITEERPLSRRRKLTALPRCDMVMSYCAGGDLFDLASKNKIPLWLFDRIAAELSIAVRYLHDNLVIHRDIKLENVLLRHSLEDMLRFKEDESMLHSTPFIELADFGLCKEISADELCTTRCGSEDYVSPEILLGLPYDGRLSDAWAIGVILYALLEDRLPFDPLPTQSSRRTKSTIHRIARCEWKWLKYAEQANDAKLIVEHTLVRKSERWNMNQVCSTEYIKALIQPLTFLKEV